MKLFKEKSLGIVPADMSDVAAYLAERGMVAVPVEPTKAMLKASDSAYETDCFGAKSAWPSDIYKAMIKAAGEQQ
jgi:hypothetical protein